MGLTVYTNSIFHAKLFQMWVSNYAKPNLPLYKTPQQQQTTNITLTRLLAEFCIHRIFFTLPVRARRVRYRPLNRCIYICRRHVTHIDVSDSFP